MSRLHELAAHLGLSDKALAKLRAKHGDNLETILAKWWDQLREKERLLGRQGGYTTSSFAALHTSEAQDPRRHPEPEAVDEETQKVITLTSHARWAAYMETNRAQEVAEQQGKQLTRKLRRLQADAAKLGVDISPSLVAMIAAAEAELAEKRKAA
jgi:hypothetical protein